MTRIRIEDLLVDKTLEDGDLRSIFGAGISDRAIQDTRRLVSQPIGRPLTDTIPLADGGDNPFLNASLPDD